jgi:hypothetical protein
MVSDQYLHESDHGESNHEQQKESFTKIYNILKALEAFEGNYHKKLNYEKLAKYLKLSIQDANTIISLILKFQKLFKQIFLEHHLEKKFFNGSLYLIAHKDETRSLIPHQITMTHTNAKLFSDITYTFKHVNRGKGFNLKMVNTELLRNIKILKMAYPYLFTENGNNLTYPSEIGLLLGEKILSYRRTHKTLSDIELNQTRIIFEGDSDV